MSDGRATGRKSVRLSSAPRDLLADEVLARAWRAEVITLFPNAFPGVLGESLTGKALAEGLWQLTALDLRTFGDGPHRKVDDTPAGGGAGLVLRADVMARAIAATDPALPLIYLSPRGRRFDQAMAQTLARGPGLRLICGRFEGLDERILQRYQVVEVSLGDFILTGGEIAAQALIDATVRLIPRVLGNHDSTGDESFSDHLLEYPQYTRPSTWEGLDIPEVLLSGHHARVALWRKEMAERLTRTRRPDLWRAYCAARGLDPGDDQSSEDAHTAAGKPQAT